MELEHTVKEIVRVGQRLLILEKLLEHMPQHDEELRRLIVQTEDQLDTLIGALS